MRDGEPAEDGVGAALRVAVASADCAGVAGAVILLVPTGVGDAEVLPVPAGVAPADVEALPEAEELRVTVTLWVAVTVAVNAGVAAALVAAAVAVADFDALPVVVRLRVASVVEAGTNDAV